MLRIPGAARACAALLVTTLPATACAVSVDAPPHGAVSDPDAASAAPPAAGLEGVEAGAPRPSPAPAAPSDADPFCPSGFAYAPATRLCVSPDEALGPFPSAMVEACVRAGGGSPCTSDRWARALAVTLRGSGLCAPGSAVDATIGYCVAGSDAYGPFTVGAVARCKAAGGGASCESMRWSVTMLSGRPDAPRPYSRTLDVPYFSQYRAAVNPGGSCGNTSAAMVLAFWGKPTTPDAVRATYAGRATCGASYQAWQCADGLVSIYAAEGLVGHARDVGTRADIKRMIDEGRPVIVHTSMTASGHIVVVVGYDEATSEWIVNDPAGRWCGDGYTSCGGRGELAQRVRYSYASMGPSVLGADGDIYLSAADAAPFTL